MWFRLENYLTSIDNCIMVAKPCWLVLGTVSNVPRRSGRDSGFRCRNRHFRELGSRRLFDDNHFDEGPSVCCQNTQIGEFRSGGWLIEWVGAISRLLVGPRDISTGYRNFHERRSVWKTNFQDCGMCVFESCSESCMICPWLGRPIVGPINLWSVVDTQLCRGGYFDPKPVQWCTLGIVPSTLIFYFLHMLRVWTLHYMTSIFSST